MPADAYLAKSVGHDEAVEDLFRLFSKVVCLESTSLLRMNDIKQRAFPDGYWDARSISVTAREYKRLSHLAKDESCSADLMREV